MRVAVIGGGAAGMMCAATINELSPITAVFLIEKNPALAKKVLISGGGRCNVTTGIEDVKTVLQKYPRGAKFLISAMHRFPPAAVRAWFEEHDVPLKCEEDTRVFPASDRGSDVVGAFEKVFAKSGTHVLFKQNVKRLEKKGVEFIVHFKDQPSITVDKIVLALGGQAYRHTGSTGDGYTLAESLGHHITPLAASLHSFITAEKWPRALAGISFTNATISGGRSRKQHFTGPFLFTHWGISGPAVFALSSLIAFEPFDSKNPLALTIDLLPEISLEKLAAAIKDNIMKKPRQSFKNLLRHFVPEAVAEVVCQETEIPLEKKSAEISRKELAKTAAWIKRVPLQAVSRGAGDEFVTAGGVELSEVDQRTMESKVCPGLYFAGEILNIDGFTGGFNLQASWATGRVAGESIAAKL